MSTIYPSILLKVNVHTAADTEGAVLKSRSILHQLAPYGDSQSFKVTTTHIAAPSQEAAAKAVFL